MKKILVLMLMLTAAWVSHDALAQQVKDFKLTNVLDNQSVSFGNYSTSQGIVLIFTSNSCPYDEYYRQRIAALSRLHADRVPVLLVNSHTEPAESAESMADKGRQLGLGIPYLADKDQTLMAALNVRKSPEAFLLKNVDGKFSIVYRGAIDDNAQVEADVRHHYLRDAIEMMLAGQPIGTPEVRPVGCNVKKKM